MIAQHRYEGTLIACLKCFKKKDDPCHIPEQVSPLALHAIPTGKPTILAPDGTIAKKLCKGHTCPKCSRSWEHDYFCGQNRQDGLCLDCAQQNASEINRPTHLKVIEEQNDKSLNNKILTGFEAKELLLRHEEFVFLNILYFSLKDNPDQPDINNPRPDGIEKAREHILQNERIIEQRRIMNRATSKAIAAREVQELNKLTPEEQEQFRRDASKLRKPKEQKVKELTKEDKKKAWEDTLKKIASTIMSTNKKITREQAIERAKLMVEEPE